MPWGKNNYILALMILGPVIWALSTVAMKWSTAYIPMELFNALRFLTIVPLIFFFKRPEQSILKIFWIAFTWFVMNFYFLGKAIGSGLDVGYLSLGYISTSVFVFVLSYFINKERLTKDQLLGTLLAFSGLVFIALDKARNWEHMSGLIYLILSTLSVALGMTLLKRFNMNATLPTVVWISSISSILLSLIAGWDLGWYEMTSQVKNITFEVVGVIFLVAYFASILGGLMWIKVVKVVGPNTSSLALFLIPILNIFLGVLFFNEKITTYKITSAIFILTGVFISMGLYRILCVKKLT